MRTKLNAKYANFLQTLVISLWGYRREQPPPRIIGTLQYDSFTGYQGGAFKGQKQADLDFSSALT